MTAVSGHGVDVRGRPSVDRVTSKAGTYFSS